MPAATSKPDLIAITEKEWFKLCKLLNELPEDLALCEHDGTTIRNVVLHRAHWVHLFLGWYEAGQAGRSPEIPAPGYNWGQLKAYNATLIEKYAGLDWQQARARLHEAHDVLLAFYGRMSEQDLYGGAMLGGGNAWTTGRWSESAGASHYRSAAKYVRAVKRAEG